MLSDLIQVNQGVFKTARQGRHTTKGGSFQLFASRCEYRFQSIQSKLLTTGIEIVHI